MIDNNGGPAFPRDHAHDGHNGMTLRDYFAAKAMQALIGSGATLSIHKPEGVLTVPMRDGAPILAYEYADAMLRARENGNG